MTVKEYIEKDKKVFIKFQKSKAIMEYDSRFDECEIVGRIYDKKGNTILIVNRQGGTQYATSSQY